MWFIVILRIVLIPMENRHCIRAMNGVLCRTRFHSVGVLRKGMVIRSKQRLTQNARMRMEETATINRGPKWRNAPKTILPRSFETHFIRLKTETQN